MSDQGAAPERPEARPRLDLTTEHPPAEVVARVRAALVRSSSVVGKAFPGRIELTVPRRDTHLWSPWLALDVTPTESGSRLHGRFAPHPHVWTMYVGACAIACMATFGALIFATAQWMMSELPWGLWVAPGTALIAALTFGAAFVGQGLSTQQMFLLKDFLSQALEAEAEAE
ncbi:MAG: hypothetical protein IPM35_32030 [Myxococcales bacterium]|nr:hypothetical protein [Myxococcales bacterium]